MSAKSFAVAAALLAASAQAGSTLGIKNSCSHPIYIFKRQGSGATGNKITKMPGESMQDGCEGQAVNYMVHSKDTDNPCGPDSPCTQLEYSEKDMLYYDMSNINGNPFAQSGMSLVSDDSSCPSVQCKPGQTTCQDAYNNPDDVRTLTCPAGCTITLETCDSNQQSGGDAPSGGEAPSSGDSQSPPDSGPSPSPQKYQPPPQQPYQPPSQPQQKDNQPQHQYGGQQQGGYDAVKQRQDGSVYAQDADSGSHGRPVVTNVVTQYKYVNEKRAAATEAPQPEKRHEHIHRHHHGAGHFRA